MYDYGLRLSALVTESLKYKLKSIKYEVPKALFPFF